MDDPHQLIINKTTGPASRDEHTRTFPNAEKQYRELCEYSNVLHDFDSFFNEMEQKMKSRSEDVYFYSKQTRLCTRDGKTVTKVTENVNGDTIEFESYENHRSSETRRLR